MQERLLSDVELGVYLSGGVDSKAVAFELGRLTGREQPMKTFTVGFKQAGYDESEEALRFARHLGFNPHLVRIDGAALDYAYPLAVQNSELVQPFPLGLPKSCGVSQAASPSQAKYISPVVSSGAVSLRLPAYQLLSGQSLVADHQLTSR